MIAVTARKIAVVLRQLELGPQLVVDLVQDVPPSILKRHPAPHVWSAHEHARHLPAVGPLMVQRLDDMLTHSSPVITPYEPALEDPDDALLSVDLASVMAQFTRERRDLLARLETLETDEWSRTAEHAEYAHYCVFTMFRHLAMHDLYHAYRIEQRLLNRAWAT